MFTFRRDLWPRRQETTFAGATSDLGPQTLRKRRCQPPRGPLSQLLLLLGVLPGLAIAGTASGGEKLSRGTESLTMARSQTSSSGQTLAGKTPVDPPSNEQYQFVAQTTYPVVQMDDILLFSGSSEAASWFAAHGVDPQGLSDMLGIAKNITLAKNPGATSRGSFPGENLAWSGVETTFNAVMAEAIPFLDVGPTQNDFYLYGAVASTGTSVSGSTLASASGTTTGPGTAGFPAQLSDGTPDSAVRFVSATGLPLRTSPNGNSSVIRQMTQGERVFVLPTLPQHDSANNLLFAEVHAIDTYPYEIGWMPLHWLYVAPPVPEDGEINLRSTHSLFAKQLAKGVEAVFYGDCDDYPLHPHAAWLDNEPHYTGPLFPPGHECGELPFGEPLFPGYQEVYEKELDVWEFSETVSVWADFDDQFRGEYEMLDLANNYYGVPDNVSTYQHYSVYADDIAEEAVRVHDTDLWFNISDAPPAGVQDVGANAYFNFCFQLPGGVLDAGDYRTDYMLGNSYVGGVDLGKLAFHPFKVCATAAIREREVSLDQLTAAGLTPSPLIVDWIHGSIQDIELQVVENIGVHGALQGASGAVIEWALDWFNFILHVADGATPWLFENFVVESVNETLVGVLNEFTQPIVSALPDPENWLEATCDRFLGAYSSPNSSQYPMYLHCLQATEAASVDLFPTSQVETLHACDDPTLYARVNDGRPWNRRDDDQTYYLTQDGENRIINRPAWATGCGMPVDVETTTADVFWPVLECLEGTLNESIAFDRFDTLRADTQDECQLPALKLLCDVYGEGEDLEAMWFGDGAIADVSKYLGFCAWYQQVLDEQTPDGPSYAVED